MKYLIGYKIFESVKHLKLFENFESTDPIKRVNNIFIDWFLKDAAIDILKTYEIKKEIVTAVAPPNTTPSSWGIWWINHNVPKFSRKGFIQRFKKDPKRDAIVWYANGSYACIKPVQNLDTYSDELKWLFEHSFTERVEGSEYRLSKDFMQLFSVHIIGEMRHRGVLIGPDGPDSLVKKLRSNLYKEFKDKLIKIAINFIKNI